MKLNTVFKLIGLSLFFVALMLFMLSQNEKIEPVVVLFPVAFGTTLALSGACLITGEIMAKIEKLEERAKRLEEELYKLKEKSNNKE